VTVPDDVVQSFWNWFVGGMWKSLEKQCVEAVEGYKQSFMGASSRSSECQEKC
jgi:hypothetical protein